MFRVKICGITSLEDARLAVEAGADAIGLNFYAGSPRCCAHDTARQIAAKLPPQVCKVGVFVNASIDEIRRVADEVSLDAVQLHGDEPPDFVRQVRPLPVVRAMRVADELAEITAYLEACHRHYATPRMLLVDARREGQYGGTGETVDWDLLTANRERLRGMPLVLAGGLNPENVAAAIHAVRPWAVDVASGVESTPGVKAAKLVRAFVASAQAAYAGLHVRVR